MREDTGFENVLAGIEMTAAGWLVGSGQRRASQPHGSAGDEDLPGFDEDQDVGLVTEESEPELMQRDLDEALYEQPAAGLDVREAGEQEQAHVSSMEVLDASELPSVDDLNAARELSVIDQAPKQEVRKAKVEVHSEH